MAGCNGSLSGNSYTTGAITENCTVAANFSVITQEYTVSASATDGGIITPSSQTVQNGETTTFTVTANDGYEIDTVAGCNGTLSGSSYTIGVITENCTVSASFSTLQSLDSLGAQKTLFALVGFSDQEKKISIKDVKDFIIDNPDSLNQFIIDNSSGKAWVDAEFMDWIDLEKNPLITLMKMRERMVNFTQMQ